MSVTRDEAPPVRIDGPRRHLYLREIAELAGVHYRSAIDHNYQANRRRAAGITDPFGMPAPDGYDERPAHGPRRPWWWSDGRICWWLANRRRHSPPRQENTS